MAIGHPFPSLSSWPDILIISILFKKSINFQLWGEKEEKYLDGPKKFFSVFITTATTTTTWSGPFPHVFVNGHAPTHLLPSLLSLCAWNSCASARLGPYNPHPSLHGSPAAQQQQASTHTHIHRLVYMKNTPPRDIS
jgi:hypothetical protein